MLRLSYERPVKERRRRRGDLIALDEVLPSYRFRERRDRTVAASPEVVWSALLAPDQNPNTIAALRLVQTGRRITAGSQFPAIDINAQVCAVDFLIKRVNKPQKVWGSDLRPLPFPSLFVPSRR